MFTDIPISAIALCYAPLGIMILGFIGFATLTDFDARRTYLRDMDPRTDDELTPEDLLAKRKTNRTVEAEIPSGSRVMIKPQDAEKKAEPSVAAGTVTGASTAAVAAPAPAPVAEPEPEPQPVAMEPEPEPEPQPVAMEPEPEPEPQPVAMEPEPEPEPQPVAMEPEPEPEPQPAAAPVRAEPDDLQKLEGIGPAVSRALIAQGIDTYAKLAEKSLDELRDALAAEGVRFAPSAESWAEQAGYAARGDWDGLAALQATLISGRYPPPA